MILSYKNVIINKNRVFSVEGANDIGGSELVGNILRHVMALSIM
jgi:hypothetical protein